MQRWALQQLHPSCCMPRPTHSVYLPRTRSAQSCWACSSALPASAMQWGAFLHASATTVIARVVIVIAQTMACLVRSLRATVCCRVLPCARAHLQMEVGIEDCLHIEFEYDKAKYHLKVRLCVCVWWLCVWRGGAPQGACV
jgi:hypothetical protein